MGSPIHSVIRLLVDFVAFLHLPSVFSHFEALSDRSTASRNYSVTHQLLLFITELTFFFRARYTRTKGDLQADRRLANRAQRSSGLHFFVLFIRLVPSCQTQLTHTRINCILKDSSCDTPLSKILKLTILASNSSPSSTNLTQDQKGLFKACNEANILKQKAIFRTIDDSPTGLCDLHAFISLFFSSTLFLLAK
ncbi:hypothetical protein H5410_041248 [Solanum commersonii]|uniref:Uncharacterized protein n=1 Tax=Solanum commersonii TaxID=4109 RepID=A0A9J5XUX7_SOLCO|nr:hypothetical protein H5410_041248 [Solanum commersonii]